MFTVTGLKYVQKTYRKGIQGLLFIYYYISFESSLLTPYQIVVFLFLFF